MEFALILKFSDSKILVGEGPRFFLTILDPVYTRENATVRFGTVPFGIEPFHTSIVSTKRFQVVPEVITIEKECVLNHKNPFFLWYLAGKIIKQTKELSFIFISLLAQFHLVLPIYTGMVLVQLQQKLTSVHSR